MRGFIWIAVLVMCYVLVAITQGQGVRTSLDFGWKFQLNPVVNACASNFPNKLTDYQCFGLEQASSAKNADDCKAACCAANACDVYQWCTNSSCSPVNSCWYGSSSDCQPGYPGWVSGAGDIPNYPSATNCTNPECRVDFADSAWRTLNLPHDYVVEGTFSPFAAQSHGYLPVTTAWYRLHFTLPPNAKKDESSIWIQFDGIYRNSYTYLNGVPLGVHPSGYTSFIYDLTESNATLNYGTENVLAVFVDPTHFEGWWYEGGGIYRHVWLTVADKLHIQPWGIFAPSIITGEISNVSSGNSSSGQFATEAVVYINTDIVNTRATLQQLSLATAVVTPSGKALGTANTVITLAPSQSITVTQTIVVENVNLWSADAPNLYKVTSAVIVNGVPVDSAVTTIGIRKVVFDVNQGLFINNNHVKIRGMCNHQDFAGVGTAVPDRINLFRVQKLKSMGVNGWRMSHNPPNVELLDFTDEQGIYVMDENRNFANDSQYYSDAELMVLRDRNHPSIIMWSVCNEAGCMEDDPAGAKVGAAFKSIIKAADPFRPVVAAMNGDWGIGLSYVLDAQGINYNYQEYPIYHAVHPYQPMFGSETASCTGARSIYVTNNTAALLSIYNADGCAHEWVTASETTPFIAGGFAWTGFDYKGEPTPYSWPEINSNFGIIDIAGFPKDTFFYYQSWWTEDIVLHLLPHWNWMQGDNVAVWAYTNAPSVELFVNGNSQGVQAVTSLGRAGWTVLFAPGSIEAKAYNSAKAVIATQTIATTGAPASIALSIDSASTIMANGQDVALVAVAIVDAKGMLVPTASNYVNFEVTNGVVLGVGNGDPASHEPDKASGRSAFGGLVRVIVQSLVNKPGTITLVATATGLAPAKITVTAV
jgi:beta-galactosidase